MCLKWKNTTVYKLNVNSFLNVQYAPQTVLTLTNMLEHLTDIFTWIFYFTHLIELQQSTAFLNSLFPYTFGIRCSLLSKFDCLKDIPKIETRDVQLTETQSGSLNCLVSSKPASVITWRHDGSAEDITEGLVKGENSLSLHFTAVTREDAGRYQCSADSGIGDPVTKDANLVVLCKCLL